jgi:hypothetical protein
LEFYRDISENCAEGDIVEATLRRPKVLVLHRGRYETRETFKAVAVARDPDDTAGREIL